MPTADEQCFVSVVLWAKRSMILSGAGRFLLQQQEAAAIFEQVCTVVSSQWRHCFRQAGVSAQDCERLAGAFIDQGLLLRGRPSRRVTLTKK